MEKNMIFYNSIFFERIKDQKIPKETKRVITIQKLFSMSRCINKEQRRKGQVGRSEHVKEIEPQQSRWRLIYGFRFFHHLFFFFVLSVYDIHVQRVYEHSNTRQQYHMLHIMNVYATAADRLIRGPLPFYILLCSHKYISVLHERYLQLQLLLLLLLLFIFLFFFSPSFIFFVFFFFFFFFKLS